MASSTHHGDRKPGSAWIPPLPRSGYQVLFISPSHSLSATNHHCPEPQPLFPGSKRSLLTRSSVFALPGTLLQTCPTQCHQRHEKDPVVPLLKPLQSFPGAFQNRPPPTPTPRLSWVFICVPSSLEALSRQWCCAVIGADKLSRPLTGVSDVNTTPQWRLQERGVVNSGSQEEGGDGRPADAKSRTCRPLRGHQA